MTETKRHHIRNPRTDECIFCGADLQDCGPCDEAPEYAPEFETDSEEEPKQ